MHMDCVDYGLWIAYINVCIYMYTRVHTSVCVLFGVLGASMLYSISPPVKSKPSVDIGLMVSFSVDWSMTLRNT